MFQPETVAASEQRAREPIGQLIKHSSGADDVEADAGPNHIGIISSPRGHEVTPRVL